MTRAEIMEKTRQVICECMPELIGTELNEDTVVNSDMGIDSMQFIYVVCKLEAELGVKIPERQWSKLSTLGEVVDAVEKRMKK